MDVLVISDTHITPERNFIEGWKKLGKYCVKNKPEYIVHLGDVADFDSLNFYVARRGSFTTEEELATVEKHLLAFENELLKAEQKTIKNKKKRYRPVKYLCLGNHDVRKDFDGVRELFLKYGWIVSDYQVPVKIDNIAFVHNMTYSNSDTIITNSEDLLNTWHCSCVIGHSHVLGYANAYSIGEDKMLHAIKCPCFNINLPDYAIQSGKRWAKGWTEISLNPFQFVWKDLTCL